MLHNTCSKYFLHFQLPYLGVLTEVVCFQSVNVLGLLYVAAFESI